MATTKHKTTQKEAVFTAVTEVLGDHGITIEPGMNVASVMNREYRAMVNAMLFQGFKESSIELETQFANDSELKAYVSGLQSNWLRKDKRLNGNVKYKPAQAGVRAGQGDAQLKALRQLLSTKIDPSERREIQSYIDARVAQIAAAKQPKVSIDASVLPPALRKYIA